MANLGTVLRSSNERFAIHPELFFVLAFWLLQGEQQIQESQNTLYEGNVMKL